MLNKIKNKIGTADISWSRLTVPIVLILLIILFSCLSEHFLTWRNIRNILRQVSMYGICAVGMSLVIMTNGVDLSMSSTIGVASVMCVLLCNLQVPLLLNILICMVLGALIGLGNGFFVNEVKMFPMMATMGMQILLRGLAYIVTNGIPIQGVSPSLLFIGQGYVLGIPFPVIVMIVLFAIGIFILHKTVYGRQIYAVGGNEEAARLAGISYKKVRYIAYAAAGVCAAIAGIIYSGRVNSGQPTAGNAYEQNIISACVLGGIRMGGGEGNMEGVLVGVVLMGILANGMSLLNVPEFWQMFVRGSVLLAAVTFDFVTRTRDQKAKSLATVKNEK